MALGSFDRPTAVRRLVEGRGEILEHEKDGLVVRPGHIGDLEQAIRRLADDPGLRQRLGDAARQKALTALAPERERDNWLTVYDRVMSSPVLSLGERGAASRA